MYHSLILVRDVFEAQRIKSGLMAQNLTNRTLATFIPHSNMRCLVVLGRLSIHPWASVFVFLSILQLYTMNAGRSFPLLPHVGRQKLQLHVGKICRSLSFHHWNIFLAFMIHYSVFDNFHLRDESKLLYRYSSELQAMPPLYIMVITHV